MLQKGHHHLAFTRPLSRKGSPPTHTPKSQREHAQNHTPSSDAPGPILRKSSQEPPGWGLMGSQDAWLKGAKGRTEPSRLGKGGEQLRQWRPTHLPRKGPRKPWPQLARKGTEPHLVDEQVPDRLRLHEQRQVFNEGSFTASLHNLVQVSILCRGGGGRKQQISLVCQGGWGATSAPSTTSGLPRTSPWLDTGSNGTVSCLRLERWRQRDRPGGRALSCPPADAASSWAPGPAPFMPRLSQAHTQEEGLWPPVLHHSQGHLLRSHRLCGSPGGPRLP